MPRLGIGLGLSARTFIATSAGPLPPSEPWLSVFNDDGSLFNFYDGLTNVTVSSMGDYDCDPVGLSGGSSVTDLSFTSCANSSTFSLPDTSGLTALTSLSFNDCGVYDFSFSDTSGLTSLTSLSFSNCGYGGYFSLLNISGLTSLTSLSFSVCGYYDFSFSDTSGLTSLTTLSFSNCANSSTFSLPDTSGLTALTSLSFTSCGYYGSFSLSNTSGLTALTSLNFNDCGVYGNLFLPTTSGTVGTLDSLTSLFITNSGVVNEAQILLILEALDTAGNINGIVTITNVSGTSTLATVISNLEGKGWTISIT